MDNTESGRPDDLDQNTETKTSKTSRKTSGRSSSRTGRKKHSSIRSDAGRFMIAKLLGLVCLVLVVFEGNIIVKLFSHRVGTSAEIVTTSNDAQTEGLLQNSADTNTASVTPEDTPSGGGDVSVVALAGGALEEDTPAESSSTDSASAVTPLSSEYIDSPKVVPEQSTPVDDSYFNNAVFIGDSRMEGFRNSSGITQGTFLTGIGLSINDMDKQIISSSEGNISVYQGLSGHQYDKIYLMLGANDLGYYPWDSFLPTFEAVLEQFHELQPHAIIYVCSVIYVDESKIEPGFEYDNNENVRTINGYILQACEELWYSYYLNLNEIFSNGNGALISDASPDGIHLNTYYLEMMLNYLKSHYITDEDFAAETAAHPDDIANASSSDDETEGAGSGDDSDDSGGDSDDSGDEDVGAN